MRIDTKALIERTDLVELIGAYVTLAKNGVEYEACCPFHTENTPSFKVNQAKRFHHCFGCGAHGDAIKFLQEHQGLAFKDACAQLGGEASPSAAPAMPPPAKAPPPEERSHWQPIIPVPAHAGVPPAAHIKRGKPSAVWDYKGARWRAVGAGVPVYDFERG
jgi:hypothetical protein